MLKCEEKIWQEGRCEERKEGPSYHKDVGSRVMRYRADEKRESDPQNPLPSVTMSAKRKFLFQRNSKYSAPNDNGLDQPGLSHASSITASHCRKRRDELTGPD